MPAPDAVTAVGSRRIASLLVIAVAALWPGPDAVSEETELDAGAEALMEADRAFASAAARRGLEGWVSFFAEDAARVDLRGEIARGTEAIRAHDAALFADTATRLRWWPTDAGLFRDGRHGFTRGRFELVRLEEAGPPTVLSRGSYLSIWRREGEQWKVILDTGAPDPPETE